MKLRNLVILGVVPTFLLASPLMAFTLLSGPNEATLPVNSDNPEITFHWDGSTPSIDERDDFKDGKYEDLSEEEFMAMLLERAFAIWSGVKGSYLKMKVIRDEDIADIDPDDEVYSIAIKGGVNLSAAAFAMPTLSDDQDTIEDCDITISDVSTNADDLLYTLVHEIGHCVGLGHNHTNYNAIMGYSRVSRMPKLGADDKAGLIYLYPDPRYDSPRKEFLACAVVGQGASGGWLLLLMPLLVSIVQCGGCYRRRTRKTTVSM